jgi:hypothetical protein
MSLQDVSRNYINELFSQVRFVDRVLSLIAKRVYFAVCFKETRFRDDNEPNLKD